MKFLSKQVFPYVSNAFLQVTNALVIRACIAKDDDHAFYYNVLRIETVLWTQHGSRECVLWAQFSRGVRETVSTTQFHAVKLRPQHTFTHARNEADLLQSAAQAVSSTITH